MTVRDFKITAYLLEFTARELLFITRPFEITARKLEFTASQFELTARSRGTSRPSRARVKRPSAVC
jgi:hypothetical protein